MLKYYKNTKNEYENVLNATSIVKCTEIVKNFLEDRNFDKHEIIRYTISVEEILLKCLEVNDNQELRVSLITGTRFFRPFISLSIDGKNNNVFLEEPDNILQKSILQSIGITTEYTHEDEFNIYILYLERKKINPLIILGVIIISAILVGKAGVLLPVDIKETITSLLTMLHTTFLNLLCSIAGPMIFLSMAWGIYGIGDVAIVKKIGSKICLTYFMVVLLVIMVCGLLSLPFYNLSYMSSTNGQNRIVDIITPIFEFVPKNLLSPFIERNTFQIIFMAIAFGIALIYSVKKTTIIAKATEELKLIMQLFAEAISKFIPFVMFIVIVNMILLGKVNILFEVGKVIVFLVITVLLSTTGVIIYTSIKNKVSPMLLVKKGLPTLITGLSTASSAASFGNNIVECRDELGIPENLYSFGLPLGIIIYKLSTGLLYLMFCLFFAEKFVVPVTVEKIIELFIFVAIVVVASPPIPGGSIIGYTIIFSFLGFPEEAYAIALPCVTILDFFATGFDQFMIPYILLNFSTKIGLTNRKILLEKH